MTEIKFPSLVGISELGSFLVYDSKGKLRVLKKFNNKTGRKSYKDKEYDGPIIRQVQFSVPVDALPSFEEWKKKQK